MNHKIDGILLKNNLNLIIFIIFNKQKLVTEKHFLQDFI